MQHKEGTRIQYLKYDTCIRKGRIEIVKNGYYLVDGGDYSLDSVSEPDVIRVITFWRYHKSIFIGVPIGLIVIGIFIYALARIEPAKAVPESMYSKCVRQVNHLTDNFNDTVGATYATEDRPTKDVAELINQCMELNK